MPRVKKPPKVKPTRQFFVVDSESGKPFMSTAGDTAKDAMRNFECVMGERFEAAEERHGVTVRRLLISEPPKRKGKR